jgi:hypothetical protein
VRLYRALVAQLGDAAGGPALALQGGSAGPQAGLGAGAGSSGGLPALRYTNSGTPAANSIWQPGRNSPVMLDRGAVPLHPAVAALNPAAAVRRTDEPRGRANTAWTSNV